MAHTDAQINEHQGMLLKYVQQSSKKINPKHETQSNKQKQIETGFVYPDRRVLTGSVRLWQV